VEEKETGGFGAEEAAAEGRLVDIVESEELYSSDMAQL
jgi:hypothetical protein